MPNESHIGLGEPAWALRHPLTVARRTLAALGELHTLNQDPRYSAYRERNLARYVLATMLIGAPMLVAYHAMDRALGLPGAEALLVVRLVSAASLLAGAALFFAHRGPRKDRVQLIASLYLGTVYAVLVEHFGGGAGNSYWVGYTTIQIFWLAFIPLPFTVVLAHGALAMCGFQLAVFTLASTQVPTPRLIESSAMLWGNLLVCGGLGILRNYNSAALFRTMELQRQAEQLRDDLVHTLVHDLKTPLTAISGSLDLLRATVGTTLTGDPAQLMEIARANSRRMQLLVETILDVNRLESGALELELATVGVEEVLDEAARLQRPVAELRGVALRVEVPRELPAVRIDRALVGRVLQNLLGNALKATPAGGLVVVEAEAIVSEGFVAVRVRDTGPGIPAELRERLFEKFATGGGGGTGLGLHFCRLAVEAHGGRIRLDHGAEGAAIRFTLPSANGDNGDMFR